MDGRYRTTVVGAVVALSAIVGATAVVLAVRGSLTESTPAIAVLIAFVAPTIAALLALLNAEKTHNQLDGRMSALELTSARAADAAEHVAEVVDPPE